MSKYEPFYNEPIQPKPVLMQTINEAELLRLREIEKIAIDIAETTAKISQGAYASKMLELLDAKFALEKRLIVMLGIKP